MPSSVRRVAWFDMEPAKTETCTCGEVCRFGAPACLKCGATLNSPVKGVYPPPLPPWLKRTLKILGWVILVVAGLSLLAWWYISELARGMSR